MHRGVAGSEGGGESTPGRAAGFASCPRAVTEIFPGKFFCRGDSKDKFLSANGTSKPRSNRIFRECWCWYMDCFLSGMKMRDATRPELVAHFFPLPPQRVNESPIITPLVTYWAEA